MTAGDRIITARMPGVTAQDTARAKIASFHKSVTGDSILGVMRARGVKTALIANEKTEGVLVDSDQLDSELSQHVKSPVISQLFGSLVCGFFCGLAIAASSQIPPQFFQQLGNGSVVQRIQSSARQNNDVQPGEQMLMMAERIANQPFDSISLHCQADIFFGNDQAQSWRNIIMSDSKNQELGTGDLELRLAEDGLIVRGRQEPQISTKTMTG